MTRAAKIAAGLGGVVAGLLLLVFLGVLIITQTPWGREQLRRVALLGSTGMSAYLGSVVLVPIIGARAYGLDGIALGLLLLPMAVAAAASSPNAARVEARLGPRRTTAISLGALGGGALGLSLAAQAGGPAAMALALLVLGTGFGLLNAPLLNELTHAFSGADQPIAVGLYNLCFFLGGAAGGAISSSLVQTGAELPIFGITLVPGFSTAELVLAALPMTIATIGLWRLRGDRLPATRMAEEREHPA